MCRPYDIMTSEGVLSGEEKMIGRPYDFATAVSWFAERWVRSAPGEGGKTRGHDQPIDHGIVA